MNLLETLQKYWKHECFREPQEEIIKAVLEKKDVIVVLPTGSGKSLCFQIPGLINKGICIVISPLIALMQDQVSSLQKKGINAIAITSKLTEHEIVTAFDNMLYGKTKFLYLSPEKLQSEFIQKKINQIEVNLIAVDEAHCISEWGHDFRSSYLKISLLKKIKPNVTIIALTATATPKVVQDISENLLFKNPIIFKSTFFRENLIYQVFKTENIYLKLKKILTKINEPAIIYVNTRKKTKLISNFLNENKFKSSFYHGGMPIEEKEKSFENWMTEKTKIIVATNAFGMGIDKNNVRLVIHIDLPHSIENYIQEAGRAGRNGNKSFSIILFNDTTLYDYNIQLEKSIVSISYLKNVYFLLNQYFQIAMGEISNQSFEFSLQDFNEKYKLNLLKTYNSILLLEREGILILDQNFKQKSVVRFCNNNHVVISFADKNTKYKNLIQLLLRSYGGIFENKSPINESYLATKLLTNKSSIKKQLLQLHEEGILVYENHSNNTYIQFLVMREDDKTINRIAKNISQRNTIKKDKANAVIDFVTTNNICRNQLLFSYFEEKNSFNCQKCDVCLEQTNTKTDYKLLSKQVIDLFNSKKILSSKEIVILLSKKEDVILKTLQLLLEKNILFLNSQHKFEKK